jgi:hypothetical protein
VKRNEVRVLVTATGIAAALGVAGFAFAGFFETTDARATDGKGGDLRPLIVKAGSVRSLFDSEDGLFPGHSADITMVVSNPNKISMTVASINPAASGAKTVTGGTTPDDAATRQYCADRLVMEATPAFAVNGFATGRRVPSAAEVTIVLRSAITLNPDTDNRCQTMQFTTRWTVVGQSA